MRPVEDVNLRKLPAEEPLPGKGQDGSSQSWELVSGETRAHPRPETALFWDFLVIYTKNPLLCLN